MQDTISAPFSHCLTPLGRIARDPARLMTVGEWWQEMDEPIEMLTDPLATFAEDEYELLTLCLTNGIPYRAAGGGRGLSFPAWLLSKFYPDNP